MLFEKHLWRHSLWHVTSRDIPKGVIVVNRFSRVASAKFEMFFRSKEHSIPLRNAHLKIIATDPNTINNWNIYIFSTLFNFKIVFSFSLLLTPYRMHLVVCKWHYLSCKHFLFSWIYIFKNVGILSENARHRHVRDLASLHSTTLNLLN